MMRAMAAAAGRQARFDTGRQDGREQSNPVQQNQRNGEYTPHRRFFIYWNETVRVKRKATRRSSGYIWFLRNLYHISGPEILVRGQSISQGATAFRRRATSVLETCFGLFAPHETQSRSAHMSARKQGNPREPTLAIRIEREGKGSLLVQAAKDFLAQGNFLGAAGNHGCLCLSGYGAGEWTES
jgi:hypothetical protein